MGFWRSVGRFVFKVLFDFGDKKPKKKSRYKTVKNTQASPVKKRPRVLIRGRMKRTDKIKGPDSKIPNLPGIYHHVSKRTGEVMYVGQTNNLKVRQQQHASSGLLDTKKYEVHYVVAKDDVSRDDLCETEIAHIERFKPKWNKTRGGNGKR